MSLSKRQELERLCGLVAQEYAIACELDAGMGEERRGGMLLDDVYQLAGRLEGCPAETERLYKNDPRWAEGNRHLFMGGFWPLGRPSPNDDVVPHTRPRASVEASAAHIVQILSMVVEFQLEDCLDLKSSIETKVADDAQVIEKAALRIFCELGRILRQSGDHLVVGKHQLDDHERERLRREFDGPLDETASGLLAVVE